MSRHRRGRALRRRYGLASAKVVTIRLGNRVLHVTPGAAEQIVSSELRSGKQVKRTSKGWSIQ
jgi:hypothetical protein